MRERRGPFHRALGIDPTSRGFGYAVLERGGCLADWAIREVPSHNRNARSVSAVLGLIQDYQPDVLALEDCSAPGSRRCRRVRNLIRAVQRLASAHTLPVVLVGPRELRERCTGSFAATKYQVAQALVRRFPELERRLPPPRKPWMTEDRRMGIFDAVGLAVVAIDGCDLDRPSRARNSSRPLK